MFLVQHNDQGFFTLFVDAHAVCTSNCLEKSFGLLFVTYYVFNLVVAKNMRKTFAFLQKYACSMHDDGSDPYMSRAHQHCLALMEKLTLKPLSKFKMQKKRSVDGSSVVTTCSISSVEDVEVASSTSGIVSLNPGTPSVDASINPATVPLDPVTPSVDASDRSSIEPEAVSPNSGNTFVEFDAPSSESASVISENVIQGTDIVSPSSDVACMNSEAGSKSDGSSDVAGEMDRCQSKKRKTAHEGSDKRGRRLSSRRVNPNKKGKTSEFQYY